MPCAARTTPFTSPVPTYIDGSKTRDSASTVPDSIEYSVEPFTNPSESVRR